MTTRLVAVHDLPLVCRPDSRAWTGPAGPAAHRSRSSPAHGPPPRRIGRPGRPGRRSKSPSTAVIPADTAGDGRLHRRASRVSRPAALLACASHSSRVPVRVPVAWNNVPTGAPASASRRGCSREHHRDAAGRGDPGRLHLRDHAAGADVPLPRRSMPASSRHVPRRPSGRPAAAGGRRTTRQRRTAGATGFRVNRATSAASRSLSPNLSCVATVSLRRPARRRARAAESALSARCGSAFGGSHRRPTWPTVSP